MTIIFRKLKFPHMKTKKSNKLSYVAIQRQKVLNNGNRSRKSILCTNITSNRVEIKSLPSFLKVERHQYQ